MKPQEVLLKKGSHETRESGMCECGCGGKAPLAQRNNARRGEVKGQPLRFINGHLGTRGKEHYLAKLSEEDLGHDTPCWTWMGSLTRDGYGRAQYKKKHTGAHRVIYEFLRGPIPKGMQLHHLCGVPRCCNPDHLQVVTNAENCRAKPGLLSADSVQGIRKAKGTHEQIAHRFGISRQHVGDIKRGTKWTM